MEAAARLKVGLSPRVRGNLWQCDLCATALRSIPAGAGEPPYDNDLWAML